MSHRNRISDPRQHPAYNAYMDDLASRAAKKAVADTFEILGVDVKNPSELEEFRRDMRFAGDLRKFYSRGIFSFATIIATLIGASIWAGLQSKLGGN